MAGNNFTLINGSLDNNGTATRVDGDYGQLGYYDNGLQKVPIKADLTEFADGTPLSSGVQQDGKSFLNSGSKLQHSQMARVTQADVDNHWFTTNGDPKNLTVDQAKFGAWNNQYYSANKIGERVGNITTHKGALDTRQDPIEIIVRDTERIEPPVVTFELISLTRTHAASFYLEYRHSLGSSVAYDIPVPIRLTSEYIYNGGFVLNSTISSGFLGISSGGSQDVLGAPANGDAFDITFTTESFDSRWIVTGLPTVITVPEYIP